MKKQKAGNNMAEGEIVAVGAPKADLERRGVRVAARLGAGENRRLVVVSNRVAVESGKPDSGGLAVAIRAALESSGGIWFGWSGEVTDEAERRTRTGRARPAHLRHPRSVAPRF